MPYSVRCNLCGSLFLARDKKESEIFAALHFHNSHSTHGAMVFADEEEFISWDYHVKHKHVIFTRVKISKQKYHQLKQLFSLKLPNFKIIFT